MKKRLQPWGDTNIIEIASCIVIREDGDVLLLQRHVDDLGGGRWGTPGGRIDKGESTRKAALRELYEETGVTTLKATILGKHEIHMPHGTVHMTSYLVRVPEHTVIVLDPEEHHAYQWFSPNTIGTAKDILWGVPTVLYDFSIIRSFLKDTTLDDGTIITRVS